MTHSTTAAALCSLSSLRTPKAIARLTSIIMKRSLIQKEARITRYSRWWIPRRWYSQQMHIAETIYPTLRIDYPTSLLIYRKCSETYKKTIKQASCARWWFTLSKRVRIIRPTAPATAARIERIDNDFWSQEVFSGRRPRWRSQRSAMSTKSKVTTLTVPIAINIGLALCAPMSEM